MGHRIVRADTASWQPSRLIGVDICDLARELAAPGLGARGRSRGS
jgi:hypothetical protein